MTDKEKIKKLTEIIAEGLAGRPDLLGRILITPAAGPKKPAAKRKKYYKTSAERQDEFRQMLTGMHIADKKKQKNKNPTIIELRERSKEKLNRLYLKEQAKKNNQ